MWHLEEHAVRAVPEWRTDPDRRAAAKSAHDGWLAAVDAAESHLRAAVAAFDGVVSDDRVGSFRVFQRVREEAERALYEAERIRTSRRPASETLVGNLAAFGVGWKEGE